LLVAVAAVVVLAAVVVRVAIGLRWLANRRVVVLAPNQNFPLR
jgi:hypothetical protein